MHFASFTQMIHLQIKEESLLYSIYTICKYGKLLNVHMYIRYIEAENT